jgi:FkbM family methyltransferase
MLINRNDTIIGKSISVSGGWENQYIFLLKELITKFYRRDIPIEIIDAGANIGVYSVALSKINGFNVKVFAIEAQRLIFQMLNANIALNSIENVWTYHRMVADKDGEEVDIQFPDLNFPANFGAFEIKKNIRNHDYDGQKFMEAENVSSIKIDSISLRNCALIKLDVEGMENIALRGAIEILKSMKPILFFERHKTDYQEVKDLLKEHKYAIWELPEQNTLALRNDWNISIPNFERIHL